MFTKGLLLYVYCRACYYPLLSLLTHHARSPNITREYSSWGIRHERIPTAVKIRSQTYRNLSDDRWSPPPRQISSAFFSLLFVFVDFDASGFRPLDRDLLRPQNIPDSEAFRKENYQWVINASDLEWPLIETNHWNFTTNPKMLYLGNISELYFKRWVRRKCRHQKRIILLL